MKKSIFLISAIMLVSIFLAACAVSNPNEGEGSSDDSIINNEQDDSDSEDNIIEVYAVGGSGEDYSYYGYENVEVYIEEFTSIYKDVDVDVKYFETQEEMDEILKTELIAGAGPDVIIFSYSTSLDVQSMAENGTFLDLTEKIEEDPTLDKNNYITGTFEAGQVNGKQYIIPLTMMLPLVLYDQDKVSSVNDSCVIDYEEFIDAIKTSMESLEDDDNSLSLAYGSLLTQFLSFSDVDSLDITDKDSIEKACDLIKLAYDDYEKTLVFSQKYGNDREEIFSRTDFMLNNNVDFVHTDSWFNMSFAKSIGIENYTMSAISSVNGEKVMAAAYSYAVVTENAHENSYDFLRIAMDCAPTSSKSLIYAVPFNISSINEKLELYANTTSVYSSGSSTYNIDSMDTETADRLNEILNSITDVNIINYTYGESIFYSSFLPYFESEKSFDDCYTEYKNKVNIYLTE